MSTADRVGSWVVLTVATALVVALGFPDFLYNFQQHYLSRFGLPPQLGSVLAVMVGIAGAFALVAPAGVWIATRIFGYTVTPPARRGRSLSVAFALAIVGFLIWLGEGPATRQ